MDLVATEAKINTEVEKRARMRQVANRDQESLNAAERRRRSPPRGEGSR